LALLLDLKLWLLVLLVSAVGTVTALAYYYLGREGTEAVFSHFPSLEQERWERVQARYKKHGSGLLFFSFIPVLGMLLETAAGAVGIGLSVYVSWVLLGRVLRNWLLVLVADQTLRIFLG
jgi:membrane protein YqaA with SNARE-associated domain